MGVKLINFYIDFLYNLLTFLTYIKYCNRYFIRKDQRLSYFRNFTTMIILQIIISYLSIPNLWLLTIALYLMFNQLSYKTTIKKNLFHVICFNILFYVLMSFIYTGSVFIFDSNTLLNNWFYQNLKGIIVCSIIYIIFSLIFKNQNKLRINNPYKKYFYLILCLIVLILCALVIYSLTFHSSKESLESVISLAFFLSIIMIILIISVYDKILDFLQESALEQLKIQKYELNQNYFDELSVKSKQLRSLRHDFKNHLGVLKGRLEQKNYEEAIRYLDSIIDYSQAAGEIIITNNPTISSILQAKKSECDRKGITFEFSVVFDKIYKISDMDLIIILGNILDNAISASVNVEPENRKILLSICQADTFLVITCINDFTEKPVEINKQLMTTKKDKSIHGMGLMNVFEVCDKYGGEGTYTYDNRTFTIKILLPNY